MKKGFTLIELLVVISIISLLSTVVLQQLNSARQKAKDAKIYTEIDQLKKAFELYRNDNGRYVAHSEGQFVWANDSTIGIEPNLKDYLKDYLINKGYISSIPSFFDESTVIYYTDTINVSDLLTTALGTDLCGDIKITKYLFIFLMNDGRVLNFPILNGYSDVHCFGV